MRTVNVNDLSECTYRTCEKSNILIKVNLKVKIKMCEKCNNFIDPAPFINFVNIYVKNTG